MDRRKFLSVSLLGLGGALVPARVQAKPAAGWERSLPAGTALGANLERLRGQVSAQLGAEYTVLGVFESQGTLYARVRFQGRVFHLKSADGRIWYTSAWTPPKSGQFYTRERRNG